MENALGPNACVMPQRGPGSLDQSDSSTVTNNISIKKDAVEGAVEAHGQQVHTLPESMLQVMNVGATGQPA